MLAVSLFRSQLRIISSLQRWKFLISTSSSFQNEKLSSSSTKSEIDSNSIQKSADDESFATMFRRSKFMQMGDPDGKIVIGRITYTTTDDLYIDFGGKFWCVCKRPKRDPELYRRNTLVLLRLHDFELSSRFLGTCKDLTLLEADAILLGLAKRASGTRKERTGINEKIR